VCATPLSLTLNPCSLARVSPAFDGGGGGGNGVRRRAIIHQSGRRRLARFARTHAGPTRERERVRATGNCGITHMQDVAHMPESINLLTSLDQKSSHAPPIAYAGLLSTRRCSPLSRLKLRVLPTAAKKMKLISPRRSDPLPSPPTLSSLLTLDRRNFNFLSLAFVSPASHFVRAVFQHSSSQTSPRGGNKRGARGGRPRGGVGFRLSSRIIAPFSGVYYRFLGPSFARPAIHHRAMRLEEPHARRGVAVARPRHKLRRLTLERKAGLLGMM